MYHPGKTPPSPFLQWQQCLSLGFKNALHALILIGNALFVWIITAIVRKQCASLISLQGEQEEQNTNAEVNRGVNVITSLSGLRAFVHISRGVMLHLLLK